MNLAIEAGYKWSSPIKQLLHAALRAIESRDMTTHLFPFMAAAGGEHVDINEVFELMIASLSLIRRCIAIARDSKAC